MAEDFDFAGVFDEDYLYFYLPSLTDERSDAQAAVIARLLDLRPGMKVLDVPCGHGRIAQRLAAMGCDVTGVDQSALFLDRARQASRDVDYRQGDMRALDFDQEFDAVVNWFTSFGYFDDDTDSAILRSWHKALKPGGKLLIDHQNRDRVIRWIDTGQAHVEQRGDDLLIDLPSYDPETERNRTERILVRDGRVRRTRFSVRFFTFRELKAWLLDAGFTDVTVFGHDGGAFTVDSQRMVTVATR